MVNFGIIYGISAFGLSQRLGIKRKEAAAIIENYFIEFPKVKEYMDLSINKAKEKIVKHGTNILGDGSVKTGAHGKPVIFLNPSDFSGTLIELEELDSRINKQVRLEKEWILSLNKKS